MPFFSLHQNLLYLYWIMNLNYWHYRIPTMTTPQRWFHSSEATLRLVTYSPFLFSSLLAKALTVAIVLQFCLTSNCWNHSMSSLGLASFTSKSEIQVPPCSFVLGLTAHSLSVLCKSSLCYWAVEYWPIHGRTTCLLLVCWLRKKLLRIFFFFFKLSCQISKFVVFAPLRKTV